MKFKLSTLAFAMLPAMAINSAIAENVQPTQYSSNSLIVTYKAGTSLAQQSAAVPGGKAKHFKNILNGRLAKLTVKTNDIHVLIKRLRKHPAIESVKLDEIITLNDPVVTTSTNDDFYHTLWGLENTGQDIRGTVGTEDADIDADIAWQTTTGSKEVFIGVIDTGVDYTHEDLVDNMWTNPGEIAGDGIDNDGNGYIDDIHGWNAIKHEGDPMDIDGHGTHVAGTIGASGNNGMGVTGVNHNVSIVGCRFLGQNGGALSGAIECLDYMLAVKKSGVNLIATNNSWGGGAYAKELFDAIEAHNEAGILFVAAAGNSGIDNDKGNFYPSNYTNDNVLAVASTTNRDGMSGFSQWGLNTVDLGAPGSDIGSTYPGALIEDADHGYVYLSGTSMAAPHVTGVAGLLASMDENISIAEMKGILMNSGDPIDALAGKTVSGKRLNAANAIAMANPVWGYNMDSTNRTVQVVAGNTASFTIDTSTRNDWATGKVDFITSGDLTATVNPTQISVGQSATLSVPTTTATPFGWYNVSVEGETDGQLDERGNSIKDRSLTFTLDVLPQGMQEFTFAKNESIAIPDGNSTGIESVISLGDDITAIDTKVWVNIPTGDNSDFRIILTSPSGTSKTVYNRKSSAGDGLVAEIDLGRTFYGETVAGDWILKVADEVRLDRATFAGWSITFDGVGELLPAAPITDFSYEGTGLTVTFTDLSTDNNNDIVSRTWDFGDGSTSTEQNPTHTFASDKGFEVSLTATDSRGVSTTRTKTVWAAVTSLDLDVPRQYLSRSGTLRNKLTWSGSDAETVSIIRNGVEIASDVANTGKYTDSERRVKETSFDYQVCDSDGVCSPLVLVEF